MLTRGYTVVTRVMQILLIVLPASLEVSADGLTFDDDIYPILEANCLNCHHNPGAPRGLSLVTLAEIMHGSINGPVVIPGDAQRSELIQRVLGQSHPRMPMNGPPYLSRSQVETIQHWINQGAH